VISIVMKNVQFMNFNRCQFANSPKFSCGTAERWMLPYILCWECTVGWVFFTIWRRLISPNPNWKFSYEGQKLKLPYISIWYFVWLQIAHWFQKCTYQFQPVTFKVDLQTTEYVHFWNQRTIYNQKKYHIDI
jgi:hypothetical protein